MQLLELMERVENSISEEDYQRLYELITTLRDDLQETKQELQWSEMENSKLEVEVDTLRDEVSCLENQLSIKPSDKLIEVVDEILKEDLWKYSYRKYDTVAKIVEALDFARRY